MTRTKWMSEGEPSDGEIRGEVLRQLLLLGSGSTICPTEVARALFSPWREKMDRIKEVIAQMAIDNEVEVTQRGEVVDIETASGPMRIRLASKT